jgi:hypothetical protein
MRAMPPKPLDGHWFFHVHGETFGPLSPDVVAILLRQGRLQFTDWAWCESLTRWTRVAEIEAFAAFIPPYPDAPLPAGMVPPAGATRAPSPQAGARPIPFQPVARPPQPMAPTFGTVGNAATAAAPMATMMPNAAPAPHLEVVPPPPQAAAAPTAPPAMAAPGQPWGAPPSFAPPQAGAAPAPATFPPPQGAPAPTMGAFPPPQGVPAAMPGAFPPPQGAPAVAPAAFASPQTLGAPNAPAMPQAPMQPLTDLTAPPPPPPPPAPVAAAPPPAPSTGMPTAPAAPPPPPPEAEGDSNQKAWIRRHTRVRLDGTVTVEDYGTFTSFDISEGGLFIVANTPIPFGTDVKLHIESAAFPKPLDMTGIVIREGISEAGETGFAIQFTRVNPAHRRVLQDYVKQKLGQ